MTLQTSSDQQNNEFEHIEIINYKKSGSATNKNK